MGVVFVAMVARDLGAKLVQGKLFPKFQTGVHDPGLMMRILGEVSWVLGAELAKRDIFPHIFSVFVHDPGPVLTLLA